MATGKYQQAEKVFKNTVRDDPGNALARYYLGRFLLAQKKHPRPCRIFSERLHLIKGMPITLSGLALPTENWETAEPRDQAMSNLFE